ncbi:MAG TPA: prephenate dehydrogenase/arogenate dehydrogenase family protein [Terriglobales bacterium]
MRKAEVFKQITIIGTGLIGGSLGLALRQSRFAGKLVGCDSPEVLERAKTVGAVDIAEPDMRAAVADADLVVIATGVRTTIDLLPHLADVCHPTALVTDVGSTKAVVAERAKQVFGAEASKRFIPGHPLAGRERGGIENASADLFRGASWLLTPLADQSSSVLEPLKHLIEQVGARVLTLTPEEHDFTLAFTSHLPQVLSNALVEAASTSLPKDVPLDMVTAGGWRDMTRLARSPQDIWGDIFATNSENIEKALDSVQRVLKRMREEIANSSGRKSS